jgi:hypothetical protein
VRLYLHNKFYLYFLTVVSFNAAIQQLLANYFYTLLLMCISLFFTGEKKPLLKNRGFSDYLMSISFKTEYRRRSYRSY